MEGWVKLFRAMKSWEWYGVPNMVAVWVHILISANSSERVWKGITIPRGSFVFGREKMADEIGISVQQLRTCLCNLQNTGEITIKSTNKYSILTVCKYDEYQEQQQAEQPAEQPTNNQQTNQQITTTKEDKEEKKRKKERDTKVSPKKESLNFPFSSEKFMSAWGMLVQQPKWVKKTVNAYQLSLNKLGKYPEEFAIELINTAIERNYQGVVFPSTDEDYKVWQKKHQTRKDPTAADVLGPEYLEWLKTQKGQEFNELFK